MIAQATPPDQQRARTLMRALVLVDIGRLELRAVPCEKLRSHEVRVRVEAVGLCGLPGGFAGFVNVPALISHRYTSLDWIPDAFAGDQRAPDHVKGVVLL